MNPQDRIRYSHNPTTGAGTLRQDKVSFSRLEIYIFYLLLILSAYFVYIEPGLGHLFFLALLAWAAFSERYYFWFAFFFLLHQEPAYFFMYSEEYHLPFIGLFKGASLTPVDLFLLLTIVKVLLAGKRPHLKLKIPFMFLMLYFIFSFLRGLSLYSSSFGDVVTYIRPISYCFWVVSFVVLIENEENVIRFLRLIFPIVLFIFFSQIYLLIYRGELISLFDPSAVTIININDLTGEVRPFMAGAYLIFLSYIGASLLVHYKKITIGKRYLYFIIVVSFICILVSATRSWFGIFLLIGVGVYLRKLKDVSKTVLLILLGLVIIVTLIKFDVISKEYMLESAWGRVAQVFDLARGEGGEIATFQSRLDRLKIILDHFEKSPIFGYGFSEYTFDNYEGHWGFFSTLFVFGLCGALLFIALFFSYFKMMFYALRTKAISLRGPLEVLLISFISMLFGYALTMEFFAITSFETVTFTAVFFGISEIFAKST